MNPEHGHSQIPAHALQFRSALIVSNVCVSYKPLQHDLLIFLRNKLLAVTAVRTHQGTPSADAWMSLVQF